MLRCRWCIIRVSERGSPARTEGRAACKGTKGRGRRAEGREKSGRREDGGTKRGREGERERGFRALRRGGCPRLRFVGNGRSITRRSSSSAPARPATARQGPMPQKTGVEPTLVLPVPPSPRKGQTLPFLLVPPSVEKPSESQGQKSAR